MVKFIITSPFILTIFYITFKFIWSEIQHRKNMKNLQKFNDFNKKLMSWAQDIKEQETKRKYMEYCLDLLLVQKDPKIIKFDEEKETTKVIKIFGKYIPELQQKNRDEQIKKILN